MATQLNVRWLGNQEQAATGYNAEAVINFSDLTETTVNTSMVFNLCLTAAGDVMEKAHAHLEPAFKASGDAAFNSTTFSFGDTGSATRFFNAVQGNENGTEVIDSFENTAYGPYTAAVQLTATVNSMAGKSLSSLDTGKLVILFRLNRAGLDSGKAAT